MSPSKRREGQPTRLIEEDRAHILSVKTLNVQKTFGGDCVGRYFWSIQC